MGGRNLPPSRGWPCRTSAPLSSAEPGQQPRGRGTPRPAPQLARPHRPLPSIALTNEDCHYSDRSPPPQHGVAASPSETTATACMKSHFPQRLAARELASPRSMP
jgi:hypothetical protein